jgi:hypothetical protein
VQSTDTVLKCGATKHVMARQTDCFERRDNGWDPANFACKTPDRMHRGHELCSQTLKRTFEES